MEEQNINPSPAIKKRPEFLSVLCILSFAGIGFAFFGSLINIFFNGAGRSFIMLHQHNSIFGTIIDNQDQYYHMLYIMGMAGAIAALICLAGVLMMWKLKKSGYFIYIIGEIAPPVVSLAFAGRSGLGGLFESFYMFSMIIGFLFPVAFIILYGVNLKHMS